MLTMLITGCSGFIGRCVWDHYAAKEWRLIGIDNLSRSGVQPIGRFANERHEYYNASIEDIDRLALPRVDAVIHLAAQVSVDRSVLSPVADFRTNAAGTLALVLWAQRNGSPPFLYASTNKVFGDLAGLRDWEIKDSQPIAPQTPYGISKATGGLYVRDILPKSGWDLRQSCIYGETQTGSEDQGWIAWIVRRRQAGLPITCYGNGTQVRDLLHVSDLLRVYDLCLRRDLEPGSYIVGGGIGNAVSFKDAVEDIGGTIDRYGIVRSHDQDWFVSANEGLTRAGWKPLVDARPWLKRQNHNNRTGK